MTSVLEKLTDLATGGHEKAYRLAVIDNRLDDAVLDAVGRCPRDWRVDRHNYEEWVRAEQAFASVQSLQQQVDALKADVKAAAELPVTTAELSERTGLKVNTFSEYVRAGQWAHDNAATLAEKARRAGLSVAETLERAIATVKRLAAPGRTPGESGLAREIESLQARIASRRPILAVSEDSIRMQRAAVARYSDGSASLPVNMLEPSDVCGRDRKVRALAVAAKHQLSRMLQMKSAQPEAEEANARDAAKIAELTRRVVEVRREFYERISHDPIAFYAVVEPERISEMPRGMGDRREAEHALARAPMQVWPASSPGACSVSSLRRVFFVTGAGNGLAAMVRWPCLWGWLP